MNRRNRGFTLVELMIALVIMMLAMTAVSTFLVGARGRGGVLNLYKQQSKIAQSGMDSIIGLEMLRKDVEHAGYGLPWNNIPNYAEAASMILNDAPSSAPRGVVSVDGGGLNGSDRLVIKSSVVAMNDACKKWTTLQAGDIKRSWTTVPDNVANLGDFDRVIVITPGSAGGNRRSLVNPGTWSTTYNNTGLGGFAPASPAEPRLIYGIDEPGGTALRMPFNRADYYLSTASVPQRCSQNTAVLVKAVVLQNTTGALDTELPLLDCVAGMQVQYLLDTDGDGVLEPPVDDVSGLTAQEIRDQVRMVQVSILAHEGQYDPAYTHADDNVALGNVNIDLSGSPFGTAGRGLHYRWKVYNLVMTADNLGN